MSESALGDERINSSQSTINCDDISTINTDLVEESKNVDEGADIVTPMINTSKHLQCREIISQKIGQSKYLEVKPNESSRRPYKRSRYGDVKGSKSTLSSLRNCVYILCCTLSYYILTASGSIVSTRSLKVRLSVNNVPIKYSWIEDAHRQNLSSQLHGWWGRLAFHPMPSLMTYASNPNTCCKYEHTYLF